ncbi:MAG: pentapeptide repeat-containing protein [Mycobacterium sp.]|nr:pentapeptide repeat-containing protein [Mycobacterium sp.]
MPTQTAPTVDSPARHGNAVAALVARIPGSMEAAAAAPVASAADHSLVSNVAVPVAPPTEALNLWAAAINSAIASRLAERIRQAGEVAATSTSLDLGLSPDGDLLSASPELAYATSIPVNETFTIPGQTFTIAETQLGPFGLSPDVNDVFANRSSVSQSTLRMPGVTVQLGSPETTIDVNITAAMADFAVTTSQVGQLGIGFIIPKTGVAVSGAISVNIPFSVTTNGPITIEGVTLTGLTAGPVSVGSCSSASSCNDTLALPRITIESDGPLLKGVIGGQDKTIRVDAEGSVGPIQVTPAGLTVYTASGPGGGPIPFAVNGDIPVDIPITAEFGDVILDGFTLPSGSSWTPNDAPSAFAIWMSDGGPLQAWSDDVGTNLIIPVSAVRIPTILLELPAVGALIGGPDTTIPITLSGGIGPIQATLGFSGWWSPVPNQVTLASLDGGEIPVTATLDVGVDVPLKVTATPVQISGLGTSGLGTAVSVPASAVPLETTPPTAAPRTPIMLPTPAELVQGLRAQVIGFLDKAGTRLSNLPENRLAGALADTAWLARKALSPVGIDVQQWGSAECVTTKDCSGQDLTGANLSGRDLDGVNFTGTVLTRADLSNATLRKAHLDKADLTNATVFQTDMTDATLVGATLTGVRFFSTATLVGADLSGQKLTSAQLSGKDFTGTNLSNAKLQSANLQRATLTGANLSGADLTSARLDGAKLDGANLSNADLTNAVISQAYLNGATLSGAILNGVWGWSTANLRGVDFSGLDFRANNLTGLPGKDLTGANFTNAHLRAIDLTGANLTNANLSGANLYASQLTGTTLTGVRGMATATLTYVDFHNAKLGGTDLSGADLSNTFLINADLSRANLTDANLTSAYLDGAYLVRANLTGANLSHAEFTGADIRRANLTGAHWQDTTCPDGSKTDTGCSSVDITPITIPTIEVGQGGVASGVDFLASFRVICRIVCTLPQIGVSANIGSGAGIVVEPITIGFLDSDNTALTATTGGPGKGVGIDVTGGVGPVTIPLQSGATSGPTEIAWHDDMTIRSDVPVSGTVHTLRTSDIATSIPYDVATWYRQGFCAFGACTWTGWGARVGVAAGDLGGTQPPIVIAPETTFGPAPIA